MTRYRLPKVLGGGEYESDYPVFGVDGAAYRRFRIPGVGRVDLPERSLTEVPPPPLWQWLDSDLTVGVPPRRTHVNLSAGRLGYNLPKSDARAMGAALIEAADMEELA